MNLKLLKQASSLIKIAKNISSWDNSFDNSQDPWATADTSDSGYLDVPFNYEIPQDREELVNKGKELFPDYIDNRTPNQHYNIDNADQIYDLGRISRFYGGQPITFTDPNGGHPGFIQYDNNTGKTRFDYQNFWQNDRDNHNANLITSLINYDRDQFDKTIRPNVDPYIDDQGSVPDWWWKQVRDYGGQYDTLDDQAIAAKQNGQFDEAARIIQEDMPALRYEMQKFTAPENIPVDYRFTGQTQ